MHLIQPRYPSNQAKNEHMFITSKKKIKRNQNDITSEQQGTKFGLNFKPQESQQLFFQPERQQKSIYYPTQNQNQNSYFEIENSILNQNNPRHMGINQSEFDNQDASNNDQSYTQILESAIHSEFNNNISHLINQNTQMIERLSSQNQFLMRHLDNLNRLFQLKLKEHKKNKKNKQKNKSSTKQISNYRNGYFSNAQDRYFSPNRFGSVERAQNVGQDQSNYFNNQQSSIKRQGSDNQDKTLGKQNVTKLQDMIKHNKMSNISKNRRKNMIRPSPIILQGNQNNNRKIIVPVRGATKYQKQQFKTEQTYVLKFLHQFLKKNIMQTPNQQYNTIQKDMIRKLYKNWKKLNNFLNKIQMSDKNIQLIITNEIKVMFNCTCSSKQYVGLVFIDRENPKKSMVKQQKQNQGQNHFEQSQSKETRQIQSKEKKQGKANKYNGTFHNKEKQQYFSLNSTPQEDEQSYL